MVCRMINVGRGRELGEVLRSVEEVFFISVQRVYIY